MENYHEPYVVAAGPGGAHRVTTRRVTTDADCYGLGNEDYGTLSRNDMNPVPVAESTRALPLKQHAARLALEMVNEAAQRRAN